MRWVLLVLLLLNMLMELAGGAMMIARPEKIAADTFGISITHETAPLMGVIGGATLSYAFVSASAVLGVVRRRGWARLVVSLLGMMLVTVGAVMVAFGLRIGMFDLAKGVVFALAGLTNPLRGDDGHGSRAAAS